MAYMLKNQHQIHFYNTSRRGGKQSENLGIAVKCMQDFIGRIIGEKIMLTTYLCHVSKQKLLKELRELKLMQ